MNRVHRMAVAGAFGGLAAATAAASVAFACTPDAYMVVEQRGVIGKDAVVRGDWEFDVHVAHFYEQATVEVDWIAPDGTTSRLAAVPGPRFVLEDVWAPAAQPTAADKPYQLVAKQVTSAGTKQLVSKVHIKASAAPTTETRTGAVDPAPQPAPTATQTPSPQAPAASPATGRAPAAQPAPSAAPQAAPSSDAGAGPGTASPADTGQAAPAAAAAPVVTGPILVGDDAVRPAPVAPADLWSGLNSNGAPSLLDTGAAPAPERGTSPVGVVLLGFGVLALAGTAAVGRRQVALSRASR